MGRSPARAGLVREPPSRLAAVAAARGGQRRDTGDGLRARIEQELLADGAPMYAAEPSGKLLFANHAYRELLQAPPGASGAGSDNPPMRLASPHALSQVERARAPVEIEESLAVGQQTRSFRSRHIPVFAADGALVAVRGVYHDVSRERALGRRAAHLRDRYDDLTRLVSDWIWEVDRDFNLTFISARAIETFGTHPRLLLGCNLFDLGVFSETGRKAPDRDWRSPFGDKPFRVVNRADGRPRLCRLSGMPIFDSQTGAFTGYHGTGNDITAQTEAEERAARAQARLAEAIESSSEAFALFDDENRLVIFNRKFREYHPMIAELIAPGVGFEELIRAGAERGQFADAVGRVDEWVAHELERQRNPEAAYEQRLSDGRWLKVSDRRTGDGSYVRLRTDITELKQREEALRRAEETSRAAREAAERANHAKSEFLANISHELRTPLNAIIGFSESMLSETFGAIGSPRYKEYIKDIHDSGVHLSNLISDILDVSKVEAGKLELDESVVDVADGITRCIRLVTERADRAKVELKVNLPKRLPKLYADEHKILQILLNLLSNAVKFTPPGGRVTTSAGIDGEGRYRLVVADTGIGIAEADLDTVMTPFGQVASSQTRQHEGTGLGLPLTKALVELHGGALELQSEIDAGTTVTVCLPKERVRPNRARRAAPAVGGPRP